MDNTVEYALCMFDCLKIYICILYLAADSWQCQYIYNWKIVIIVVAIYAKGVIIE